MKKKLDRLLRPGMGMYFAVMGVFCFAGLVRGHLLLAFVETLITLGVLIVYTIDRSRRHRELQRYIRNATDELEGVSHGDSPFPLVLARLGDGGIVWANRSFCAITGFDDKMMEQELQDLIPDFSTDWLATGKTECPNDVTIGSRRYRVYGSTIRAEDTMGTMLGVLYFTDLTELYQIRDEYVRSRPVVSLILIDNYEELTKNMTESGISNMNARINETITQWTENYGGLLRRLERNRFLYIFEKRDLSRAIEDKFSLLENIHEVVNSAGLSASISFGLGVDGSTFEECFSFASLGIEMALSRGGDQAVIKDRFNFAFYGGRSQESDYRSKVRSRVTANSLMELIGQSSQVFIMGHRNADMDAVGAAVGVACLCRKRGKKAHIVLDLENNSSQRLLEEIRAVPEYKDTFISGQEALVLCDNRSILWWWIPTAPTRWSSNLCWRPSPKSASSTITAGPRNTSALWW